MIGEIDAFVDNELRPAHPDVTIETWGHKRLADEISKLSDSQIEKIIELQFAPPVSADGPVVDLIDISNNGGGEHFAKFAIKNIGTRTALNCRLSLVGDDGYEWSSDAEFSRQNLAPDAERQDIQLRKEGNRLFDQAVENLRLVIEYEDMAGSTITTGRNIRQELVPSKVFYNLYKGNDFMPPTVLRRLS